MWHIVHVLHSRSKDFETKVLKNIDEASQASLTKIFSIRCNTQYFILLLIGIAFSLLKQCLICIQIFGSLFSNVILKVASVEQESASAVASVEK